MNGTRNAEHLTREEAVARLERANAEIIQLRAEAAKRESGHLEGYRAFSKRMAQQHRIFMEEMNAARPRHERILERAVFVVLVTVAVVVSGTAGWLGVHLLVRFGI